MTTIKVIQRTVIGGTLRQPGEVLRVPDDIGDELVRDGMAEVREPPGPTETTARDDDEKELV